MFIKSLLVTIVLALFTISSTASVPHDSIKGEWLGVFSISGHTADVTMKFDVHGSKVTGTVVSEHTGPGTVVDGKWENDKLTCTLKFEKHESIEFQGWFKDGKFQGDFKTEGNTGTWTATRK